jgi:hypothetical protein
MWHPPSRSLAAAIDTYRRKPRDRPGELAETLLAALPTTAELAQLAELAPTELQWYADLRGMERRVRDERLRHYRYSWRPSARRTARLVEAPKDRLKLIQRRILRDVLTGSVTCWCCSARSLLRRVSHWLESRRASRRDPVASGCWE